MQHYDYVETGALDFNELLRELGCRRRFHEIRDFTILVVDYIFNKNFDLIRIPIDQVQLNMLDHLLGFDSDVFKQICQDTQLFEYFVQSLMGHLRRTRWPMVVVQNSVFASIFQDLLNRFLPLTDDNLARLKGCDWFSTFNRRSAKGSALRLLRPEVIAAAFEPEIALHSGGGMRSMYPKVYDFSKFMFEGLANCSAIPVTAQVYILNTFIIHYLSFLFARTYDVDFEKFKQMSRESKLLEKNVKPFLNRWLQTLGFDEIYEELLEIWLYLIYPADESISTNREKMVLYFKIYSKTFIDLLNIIENRCRVADLTLLSHARFIGAVVDDVFDAPFCAMYRKLKVEPDDFLDELRQKVAQFQFLLEEQRRLKENKTKENWLSSIFGTFQGFVNGPTELEKELQYIINLLNAKLDGKELRIEHSGISNSSSLSSFSPQAVSTPNLTPDHKIDKKTKMMYLTDDGRKQVLQRKATFDFGRCVNRGNRSILPNSYEIPFLVIFFAHLSKHYSDSKFVQWMRFHRHSSRLAGILSYFLLAPSPPRYVPVYSKTIVPRLPQLNLRFMASYYFVFSFLFIILFLFGSLYRIIY